LYEQFKEKVKNGVEPKKVLDELGLKRYCCRSMFVGQVDLIDDISRFRKD
jgi:DNA-directed RNA polymerase subunit N